MFSWVDYHWRWFQGQNHSYHSRDSIFEVPYGDNWQWLQAQITATTATAATIATTAVELR